MLLQADFEGKWLVENVIPWYKPLIAPTKKVGRHLFWANFDFNVENSPDIKRFIKQGTVKDSERLKEWLGIHYDGNLYYEGNHCAAQVLRNAVHPDIGRQIMRQLTQSQWSNL